MSTRSDDIAAIGVGSVFIAAMASLPLAWLTHVIWFVRAMAHATDVTSPWPILLGLLGTFVPPIGILHGFMIWLGAG